MIRRRSSSTNPRPHWLQRLALMLFGCTHVLTAGLLTQATTALGQGERASPIITEIWMGSGGLVLTRRIPQERQSVLESDEAVARTMVEIAQQRYDEGDQSTASWLVQWARQLTNGRIGSNGFAQFRRGDVSAADDLPINRLDDRLVLRPAPLEFNPAGPPVSQLEVTTGVIGRRASPTDQGFSEVKIEPAPWGEARRPDLLPYADSLLSGAAGEKQSPQDENRQPRRDQWDGGESEIVPSQHGRLIEGIGRQVAVVGPDSGHIGLANQVNRQSPAESTVEPIAIAAIGFASGTVFCALLCTFLLLVPVRLTIRRQAESQFQATAPAEPAAETRSATSVSANSQADRPVFKIVGEQDRANSVVEEFYHQNVALLKQLHDQAIPSVGDAKDNHHHHIGAVHG